ncbi:hypothetical protein BJ912DRAFT_537885 [Pholiota molesta]|nr:hypothetical protein BJ912DRAFT_537885 [Pholiota molesta]
MCLAQAALIHSLVVLDGLYPLSFIIQTYMILRRAVKSQPAVPHIYIVALHAVPCISFIGAFVAFLIYGLKNPLTPERSPTGMYCHISSPGPREIAGAIAIVAMVFIISVEALIVITLRRISGSLKSLFRNDSYIAPDALIRVVIFCIGPLLAIIVSAAQYFDKTDVQTAILSIILALVPIFVVVVFGSQKDVLRIWVGLCRRDPAL